MEINNLNSGYIAYLESVGLSKVFAAYAENATEEEINTIGFNQNSGYIYIYLENGLTICSCLGNEVEYLIYNSETEEEEFYTNYNEAIKNL